jgi:exopolyphosphatase/pppGpp-phosphohydrolase
MLGTSGTVTTIAGVHLNLKRYDRNRVDGCWMSAEEINAVVERLLTMSYEDRVASPCIGAGAGRSSTSPAARSLRPSAARSLSALACRRSRDCAKACWCR